MTDWATISSLATAGGTLVLAVATFASVRSANRAARVAEESLLAGIHPLLIPSRREDPPVKVGFMDGHFVRSPGGGGTAEIDDQAIYLTLSLRNAGNGIAVLHGWRFDATDNLTDPPRPSLDQFRRLNRDLFLASGEVGFWQGAIRDHADPDRAELVRCVAAGDRFFIDLLYGDFEGGQRTISRFSFLTRTEVGWLAGVSKHWNVDRPDPR